VKVKPQARILGGQTFLSLSHKISEPAPGARSWGAQFIETKRYFTREGRQVVARFHIHFEDFH
jgi:hypothetical protein